MGGYCRCGLLSKRYLVVSRAPAGRLHFDIVVARNEALAEDKVRSMRRGVKVGAGERCQYPVAMSLEQMREVLSAMEGKPDEAVERKFMKLLETSPKVKQN
jgi:hypothetical protein